MIKDGICEMTYEFIERIANYYQFNLRNGNRKVENAIMVNFTENMSKIDLFQKNKQVLNKNYQRRIKNLILTNYYNNDDSIKNLITIATTEFNDELKDQLFNYYEIELNKEKHYYQLHGDEASMVTENYTSKIDVSEAEIEVSLKIFDDMKLCVKQSENAFELKKEIEKLNQEEKKLIKMIYFDGLSTRDVAKELNTHKTQIIRKNSKILKKLAKMIK
jgi:DNA-directed RNA polymerase specialized sigma subunit